MKFSKLREFPLLETAMFIIMSYGTFVLAELMGLTGMYILLVVVLLSLFIMYRYCCCIICWYNAIVLYIY